jgi:O-antigen/teichoic acid export membrane protein
MKSSLKEIEPSSEAVHHDHPEFKSRTARGALASLTGQGGIFILRLASMMIMARLLSPRDFGLVGMATAITGFLILFQDAGLSSAAIQSPSLTRGGASMLFWINLALGGCLALFCILTAPLLAAFFHEPRVRGLTIVLATGFLFNGASAQHRAMLCRNMRITAVALSDFVATALSIALGIALALLGGGYWSLAVMAVFPSFVGMITAWSLTGWIPGLPRRGSEVLAMLKYGGLLMANTVLMYVAYNMDKVLLGRFAGAAALGFYGRAYTLVNIPVANLNTAVVAVAFPALSRLQGEAQRFRNYFLKYYTLFLTLSMPITVACGLFGEDIIRVFLGPKWQDAVPVFRLLAPTILVFALINPTGQLLNALGRIKQSLRNAFLITPVVILGYVLGLPYGPLGVAAGFSLAMLAVSAPVILLAIKGSPVSPGDIWLAIRPPLYSVLVAAGAALLISIPASHIPHAFFRLLLINGVLFGVYAGMLVFVMRQKELYLSMLKGLGFRKREANL